MAGQALGGLTDASAKALSNLLSSGFLEGSATAELCDSGAQAGLGASALTGALTSRTEDKPLWCLVWGGREGRSQVGFSVHSLEGQVLSIHRGT
jgi:hypothetical protein